MAQKSRWSRDITKKLIELIESKECLWNVQITDYRNKKMRLVALNEIGIDLNMTPYEIKQKIHHLRSQFTNERNKMRTPKSASGTKQKYVTKWEYFDALKFMFRHTSIENDSVDSVNSGIEIVSEPKKHVDVMIKEEDIDIEHEIKPVTYFDLPVETDFESLTRSTNSQSSIFNGNDIDNEDDDGFISLQNSYSQSSSSPVLLHSSEVDTLPHYEKRHLDNSEELSIINRCLGVLENAQAKDECTIFGQYVASELRLIHDESLRYKLKRAIQTDILQISNEYASKRFRSSELVSSISEDGVIQEFRVL